MREMGYAQKIYGLTGHVLPKEKQQFLQAGADALFEKPIRLHTLTNIVKGVISTLF